MQQESLFIEDINEAIRNTVTALKGPKVVGGLLWPTINPDTAATRMRDCMNPKEREKLGPEELLFLAKLGREKGCHILISFLCGEAGYSVPVPVDPEDERAALQRQVIEAAGQFKALVSRLERVTGA